PVLRPRRAPPAPGRLPSAPAAVSSAPSRRSRDDWRARARAAVFVHSRPRRVKTRLATTAMHSYVLPVDDTAVVGCVT
ncbi:hypothetical protein, partial [Streptomyces sp. NPDC004658]|uniref:hypothetical protein n=1 Tax=Streptomyces sp. NPDC004658 TaxID=3154672 RepID=UPI0033B3D3BD